MSNEEQREKMQKTVSDWEEKRKKQYDAQRKAMKESFLRICTALDSYGVSCIEMEYDGYGDSGTLETVLFLDTDNNEVKLTEEQDMSVTHKVETKRWLTPVPEDAAPDIERTWEFEYKDVGITDGVTDMAYRWLPAGWEINDGSLGCIKVDVSKRSYAIEHGWRETVASYEEYSFDFDGEEASS